MRSALVFPTANLLYGTPVVKDSDNTRQQDLMHVTTEVKLAGLILTIPRYTLSNLNHFLIKFRRVIWKGLHRVCLWQL